MEGFGQGLADMMSAGCVIFFILVALLIVAVVASFVGWPKVLACWPYAVAFMAGWSGCVIFGEVSGT